VIPYFICSKEKIKYAKYIIERYSDIDINIKNITGGSPLFVGSHYKDI